MTKKQKSFADKVMTTKKKKDSIHVRFVKSVPSNKEGFWRFNESMIEVEKGQKPGCGVKTVGG